VPSFDAEAEDVLEECARLHLEGLVAKRVDSRYEPGKRSAHWRKVKCAEWRERHAPLRHEQTGPR
jgi:bifunctional non-homologous end joining protein LigD